MEDKSTTTTGGASAATAKKDNKEAPPAISHATSGEILTNWLNRRLSERGNVTIPLGTKPVVVNRLLPDARLEVEVPDADGLNPETQHVAFDEKLFDLLLPKLANV